MSGEIDYFDPLDFENIFKLLPEGCQGCSAAEFAICAVMAFGGAAGSPLDIIRDIQEKCSGYKGANRSAPGESFDVIETPTGVAFASVADTFMNDDCPMFGSDDAI